MISPFPVDLVLSGIQSIDPALELFVTGGEAGHLRLDPLAGARPHHLVAAGSGGAQLLGDACPLPAAHEDLVLDEPLELADSLLEVHLLAFFDFLLVDEDRLVERVVEPRRVYGGLERRAVGSG